MEFSRASSSAYDESVELAKEKGPFPLFDRDKYVARPFIQRLPPPIRENIYKYGIRNCYLTVQAPTGTIALLAGVNSGIEPYFDFSYKRVDRTGESEITSDWATL